MLETLTSREAAERLGIAVSTFHNDVAAGRISPVKKLSGLRGAYLFAVEDVDRLAAERAEATS